MQDLSKFLQRFENALIAICFIVMTLCAFSQVVNRNFIGAGISWFDELARYSMVYLTLLATEAGLRDGSQIAISAFTDRCPPVLRRILQLLVKLIIVLFSSAIFWTSIELVQKQIKSGQTSAAMGMPMWLPYLSLPICFAVITVVQVIALFSLAKSQLPEAKSNKEEEK